MQNVWPNKVEYSISTPCKAVIFGTAVPVDFRLTPLLKGLTTGTITSQLIEYHELVVVSEENDPSMRNGHSYTRIILTDSHQLTDEEREMVPLLDSEGIVFQRVLQLPKTLNNCLQDADTRGIRIKHKLKFRVQLNNPDGHTSEVGLGPFLSLTVYKAF